MVQAYASLCVHLEVRIKVVVTKGAFNSSGGAIGELIGGDVWSVVREANADRKASTVVCGTDVPSIGRVPQKPRMIGTAKIRSERSARSGVAIVCGYSHSAEETGKKRQMLQVGDFEPTQPSAAGVERLADCALGYCGIRAVSRAKNPGVGNELMGSDRVFQILIKIPSRDHAEVTEVMFDQQIDIVRNFRFEIRIAEANEDVG